MLVNRTVTEEEFKLLGLQGKLRESSSRAFGDRIGVVLVHGRAGDEGVMWVFSRAIESLDPVVFSPRAIYKDDYKPGYSWWQVDENRDGSLKDSKESKSPNAGYDRILPAIEALEHAVNTFRDNFGIKEDNLLGIGFSQGGALLSSLALKSPNLFRGVAVLASFIPLVVQEKYSQLIKEDNKTAFFMSHGTEDEIIPFSKACITRDFLEEKIESFYFHSDKVGHKISSSGIKELKVWIEKLFR